MSVLPTTGTRLGLIFSDLGRGRQGHSFDGKNGLLRRPENLLDLGIELTLEGLLLLWGGLGGGRLFSPLIKRAILVKRFPILTINPDSVTGLSI